MSILQYPKKGYFNIINSASAELGTYVIQNDGDLSLAHVRVYHKNPNQFNYQIRLVIAQREGGPALAVSNWEAFNNASIGQTDTHWLGDLTFTFEDYALKSSDSYAVRLESIGYTRTSNSIYMGVWMDWAYPVGIDNSGGARVALGVKR